MPAKKLVETIYGKSAKYEVYKETRGFFSSLFFPVYKNDQLWKTFRRLDSAIDAINKEKNK